MHLPKNSITITATVQDSLLVATMIENKMYASSMTETDNETTAENGNTSTRTTTRPKVLPSARGIAKGL